MTVIVWDTPGDRVYETGVDRGVLYLEDGSGVPWNGLTSVTERSSGGSVKPIHFNGVKIDDEIVVGEYEGTIKAYTYPDEFLGLEGAVDQENLITSTPSGVYATNQQPKRFGLSYRTLVGNDIEGEEHGYKIHILTNLLATPSNKVFNTIGSETQPIDFEWNVTGIPTELSDGRPTCHLIVDSRKTSPVLLAALEDILYGTVSAPPSLPSLFDLVVFARQFLTLAIFDNGDGTWTAYTPYEGYITMTDATTFSINAANAVIIDANSYTITDTV